MEHIQLFTKISYLPADLKSDVNDFIDFLLSKKKKSPTYGCLKDKVYMSADFDEPLIDFKDYM